MQLITYFAITMKYLIRTVLIFQPPVGPATGHLISFFFYFLFLNMKVVIHLSFKLTLKLHYLHYLLQIFREMFATCSQNISVLQHGASLQSTLVEPKVHLSKDVKCFLYSSSIYICIYRSSW